MTEMYPRRPLVPRPPKRRFGRMIGVLLLAVAIGVGLGGLVNAQRAAPSRNQSFGTTTSAPARSRPVELKPATAAAKVKPGLVDVDTVLGDNGREAVGTGMVLTPDGEILTNNHVVAGATSIRVTDVGNGKSYPAKVLGYDRTQDIAVLRLANASGLRTVPLGDSDTVDVGDQVLGIGNAGGKGGTPHVAAGRVADLNRAITATDESGQSAEQLTGLIQINADIKPGDSGGALVNSAGKVVGMDTAASVDYRLSATEKDQPQGFAIPIGQALPIAHQIVAGTSSSTVHIGRTALLGVSVSDAGQAGYDGAGAAIAGVAGGSAADDAGLSPGDVITAVDGADVSSASALTKVMDTHHPGDKLVVGYTDGQGGQHTVTVVPTVGPVG